MLGFESAEEICRVPASDLYWQVGDRDTFLRRIEIAGGYR